MTARGTQMALELTQLKLQIKALGQSSQPVPLTKGCEICDGVFTVALSGGAVIPCPSCT